MCVLVRICAFVCECKEDTRMCAYTYLSETVHISIKAESNTKVILRWNNIIFNTTHAPQYDYYLYHKYDCIFIWVCTNFIQALLLLLSQNFLFWNNINMDFSYVSCRIDIHVKHHLPCIYSYTVRILLYFMIPTLTVSLLAVRTNNTDSWSVHKLIVAINITTTTILVTTTVILVHQNFGHKMSREVTTWDI